MFGNRISRAKAQHLEVIVSEGCAEGRLRDVLLVDADLVIFHSAN